MRGTSCNGGNGGTPVLPRCYLGILANMATLHLGTVKVAGPATSAAANRRTPRERSRSSGGLLGARVMEDFGVVTAPTAVAYTKRPSRAPAKAAKTPSTTLAVT